ncbi:MAG: APC family permease [bacterium]|nr:APC family permease [bacterium]
MNPRLREFLLGQPLSTSDIRHERLTKKEGLAIFASDALSSTAYATEEILWVLATAGAALVLSPPIALVIVLLIFLVSISYTQAIHAYPQNGGVYNVARHNLGETASLVGASSLLIDYVLTAAVSTAAGVAAITSAIPELYPYRVSIAITILFLLKFLNLRGIRESGKIFMFPAYAFIASIIAMIGYGIFRYASGTYPITPTVENQMNSNILGGIGLVMLCRAFASGCAAMTGIEAISNGVQTFKHPEPKNASNTLIAMAIILSIIFLGITALAFWGNVRPNYQETVISTIAKSLLGPGYLYFIIQGVTAVILILAANTPFAGFPRVASQLAKDGYFPKQFNNLGSRLVFTNGIILLAGSAWLLIIIFDGNVHALIPLYAVGVFLGFSLSQLGMVIHWLKIGNHKKNIALNLTGFLATTVVFLIVFLSKFTQGAWILVPSVIILVLFMKKLKNHYILADKTLQLDDMHRNNILPDKTLVFLVSNMDKATLYAISYIKILQPKHIIAIHVAFDLDEGTKIKEKWEHYVPDIPLQIVYSEYRDLIGTTLDEIKKIQKTWDNDNVTVVFTERVPSNWFEYLVHNQTAAWLYWAIKNDPDIDVQMISIPNKISMFTRTSPTPSTI